MYIITARKNLNQVIPVNILQYCVAHILKNATQVFFFFCWRLVGDTVFSKETFAHIQSGKSMFCCQLGKMKWQPTPVFLPGKSHGQRSLAGYSSWGCKKSDMTEWLTLSFLACQLTYLMGTINLSADPQNSHPCDFMIKHQLACFKTSVSISFSPFPGYSPVDNGKVKWLLLKVHFYGLLSAKHYLH